MPPIQLGPAVELCLTAPMETSAHSQQSFANQLAVVTGGADGMGRGLVERLAAEGCHVAFCDLSEEKMEAAQAAALANAPDGTRVTAHVCDVADEAALERFRDEILAQHAEHHDPRPRIDLLFNNAGVGGGGSMVTDDRAIWERTFAICWGGVYLGTRVFLPLLMASDDAHIVNTSSVNGFWASLGPERPHTAYSAAKFAVKGFTEALLQDLRLNAPNVMAHVVMPGHIGTGIAVNTLGAHGIDPALLPEVTERAAAFRNNAPTTADQAVEIILDAVRQHRWRILVGDDAEILDALVRDDPEAAYEPEFRQRMAANDVLSNIADAGS